TSGVLARSIVRSIRQQTSIGESNGDQLLMRHWGFQHNPLPAEHAELRRALESMVTTEADNPNVWATLANVCIVEHSLLFNLLPDPLGRALRAARRAIELDHGSQEGWQWL